MKLVALLHSHNVKMLNIFRFLIQTPNFPDFFFFLVKVDGLSMFYVNLFNLNCHLLCSQFYTKTLETQVDNLTHILENSVPLLVLCNTNGKQIWAKILHYTVNISIEMPIFQKHLLYIENICNTKPMYLKYRLYTANFSTILVHNWKCF